MSGWSHLHASWPSWCTGRSSQTRPEQHPSHSPWLSQRCLQRSQQHLMQRPWSSVQHHWLSELLSHRYPEHIVLRLQLPAYPSAFQLLLHPEPCLLPCWPGVKPGWKQHRMSDQHWPSGCSRCPVCCQLLACPACWHCWQCPEHTAVPGHMPGCPAWLRCRRCLKHTAGRCRRLACLTLLCPERTGWRHSQLARLASCRGGAGQLQHLLPA